MKKERPNIDQALCNHARILIAGGATTEMAAELLEIGQSTLQKIRRAGFDAEKYTALKQQEKERMARAAQVETSKEKEKKRWTPPEECWAPKEEQVPGQLQMELPEKTWQQELTEIYAKHQNETETAKIMRFEAAMTDKMIAEQERIVTVLDKINDTLSMLLRAIRKE